MSVLFEKNSQTCVPMAMEDSSKEDRLRRLFKVLREMVNRSSSQLKSQSPVQKRAQTMNHMVEAVPLSFKVAEDRDIELGTQSQFQKRRGIPTKLVGAVSISFKLPDDCAIRAVDVDKLTAPQVDEQVTPGTQNLRRFSFSERLDGWRFERRQRNNGRFDTYYYHEKSNRMLRSTIEVVNFIMYEDYPVNKVVSDKDSSGSEKRKNITSVKRKWATPGFNRSKSKEKVIFPSDNLEEEKMETVEEFLAAAYENLLKSSKNNKPLSSNSESEPKENTGLSSDNSEEKTVIQTVEEFLDVSYKNMLNQFNGEARVTQVSVGDKKKTDEPKEEKESKIREVMDSMSEFFEELERKKGPPSPADGLTNCNSEQLDLINHIPTETSPVPIADLLVYNRN